MYTHHVLFTLFSDVESHTLSKHTSVNPALATTYDTTNKQLKNTPRSNTCNIKNCKICSHIICGTDLIHNGKTYHPNATMTCRSTNLIYVIKCNKCDQIYVGQTTSFRSRFWNHKHRIYKNHNNSVANHFNSPRHTFEDFKIFLLEQINENQHETIRHQLEQRESMWIDTLDSHNKGLNTTPGYPLGNPGTNTISKYLKPLSWL